MSLNKKLIHLKYFFRKKTVIILLILYLIFFQYYFYLSKYQEIYDRTENFKTSNFTGLQLNGTWQRLNDFQANKPTSALIRKSSLRSQAFVSAQQFAKSQMSSYCAKNSDVLPKFEKGFSSLVINRKFDLLYCPIYKVASTSFAIVMLKLLGPWKDTAYNMEHIRDIMNEKFEKVEHKNAPQKTEKLTKLIIVRHPLERLLSAYRNKFENGRKYYFYRIFGEKMVSSYRKLPHMTQVQESQYKSEVRRKLEMETETHLPKNPFANPPGPTFNEFVKYVITDQADDDHWRPYYIQCSLCHMTYDYVLRFENLKSDADNFLTQLGLENQTSLEWKNPTLQGSTSDKISCSYFRQISAEDFNSLVAKYLHDFALFDYSYDEYLECLL